ncbi:hypothetical protein CASFOL_001943 [Castilleja foliolosa]|uniref:mannosyl-glycoprotein endo-beta-N-acetylglucosaminidase n=1 Tax=Castilleja foliolosa TaxID=1961234 RepID=A0ABD3ED69_9LAMI
MDQSNKTGPAADDPPPFDPLAPGVPISYPLNTLHELESREYFKSFHFSFNQASVKLPASGGGPDLPRRPRILSCHDMQGGYTNDKLVQGGGYADAYAIWHWYLMDVFVYFSHYLVTLPPPCWINAAHAHGVKVLGTFIMEAEDGAKRLNKMISTKASAQMYAERLAELATALGFDGWLLNLEANAEANLIPNLLEFVSHLTQTMHSSVAGSLVIWYDSITTDGFLSWQNQLNELNKPFFDRCDGIFVNYFWEEDLLKKSGDAAGDRKFDVYMGVDVFGRGTYGDGQWNTHVALDVIKKYDVSAAIYAPGWLYETKQPPDFQTAQNRWWALVEKSWGILQKYPKALPFYSNFDQGHGYHISVDGQQVWNSPWNNISSQTFQPFIEYPGDNNTQPIQVSIGFKEASYSGGGNITFKGALGKNPEFMATLFQGELLLGNFPVHFTYSVKSSGNSYLGFVLKSSNATNEKRSIFLAAPENTSFATSQFTETIMPHRVTNLEADPGWVTQEFSINMKGHVLKEIRAVCYSSKHRKADDQYYAVLGDIKITKSGEITTFPPPASWLLDGQFISWASGPNGSKLLSVKITWKLKDGIADVFSKYNVYVSKLTSKPSGKYGEMDEGACYYLGLAAVKSFYVSNLEVASTVSSLKFVIQVCGLDGSCQNLEDSPFFLLPVQGTKIMKEERLECKCGRKITITVSEKFENSGKIFDCFYVHGPNLNGYKGYYGPTKGTKDEGCKMLQRCVEMGNMGMDETQGELGIVCLLAILYLIIIGIYMYWIACF